MNESIKNMIERRSVRGYKPDMKQALMPQPAWECSHRLLLPLQTKPPAISFPK